MATWTSGEPVSSLFTAYSLMSACLRSAAIDFVTSPFRAVRPSTHIEHTPGLQHAAFDVADRDRFAPPGHENSVEPDRSIPATQKDGLALLEACCLRLAHGQRRDVVQRGLKRAKTGNEAFRPRAL